ncbi:MAG TPA: NTP transferase domain-containing protein [Mycobacteriales bacterium]|nr:NTP transferase domain-containing protein [Mycobacteriales bacterium]
MTYDGIVLAGGAGSRLGGTHKPNLTVAGHRLLDVAIDALSGAATVIVVGPVVATARPVTWVLEDPPGGGPVAALAAGLSAATASSTVVLASDLPFISASIVASVVSGRGTAGAAIAVDDDGCDQPLIGCYDTGALRAVVPSPVANASMRSVLQRLERVGEVRRIATPGAGVMDCDTPDDIARAEALA